MKAQKASGSKKSSQLAKAMNVAKKFAKSVSQSAQSSKDKKSAGPKNGKPAAKGNGSQAASNKMAKPAPKPQVAGKSSDKGGMSHNGKKASAPASSSKVQNKSATGHPSKGKGAGGSMGVSLSRKTVEVEAVCREVACEGLSTTGGYCRLHYIKNWKKIKRKELILKEGKLNQYIEELVVKYPDKYIEAIRQDLAGDKEFAKVIYDLDLDESVDDFDVEGDSADGLIDSIKRDFEDDGEGF